MPYPCLKMYYTLEVRKSDGKMVARSRRLSRSFVRAMSASLYGGFQGGASTATSASATNGNTANVTEDTNINASTDKRGIVVGSGTAAVLATNYALGSLIVHGVAAGSIDYGSQTLASTITTSDPNTSFTVTRTFQNSSGSTLTVNELGIYAGASTAAGSVFCIVRDIVAGGQAVNDGQTLTVVYTIQTST